MGRREATLRSKLIILLLGATVPLLVMALANAWISYRSERERMEHSTDAVARGVALGVALEVQRGLAGLNALALSRPLCADDLPGFREQLVRFMEVQHPGANAVLSDAKGQQLINLLATPGQPLPRRRNLEQHARTLARGSAVVSDVYAGTFQERVVTLEVPVHCSGVARYSLLLAPRLDVFQSVLREQRSPADWSLLLLDGRGEVIARAGQEVVVAPSWLTLAGGEGVAQAGGSPGRTSTTLAHSRVGDFGWSVLVQRPLDAIDATLARSVALLMLTGLLLVVVGGAFAVSVARSVIRPMERLGRMAADGHVRDGSLPPSGVREIDAVAHRLQQAMRELQSSDQRKSDFVATLAHELRNPLAPLMNALVLLRSREGLSTEGDRLVSTALRQVRQVRRLVEDLLELGRLGQGKLSLVQRVVDLRDVIGAALESVGPRLEDKRQVLTLRLSDDKLLTEGDELRLTQVFTNLLDNASKYSIEGGAISVEAVVRGGEVVVEVKDEGQGLESDQAAQVFEMYWQAGTASRGGLGIGLALVKRLVEAHGGRIEAASPGPGKGSTFTVRLRACPPAQAPSRAEAG